MRRLPIAASVAAMVAGFGVYRWATESVTPGTGAAHDERLVKDRMWIDHIPQHDRDRIHVFVALTDRPRQGPRGPVGVFEKIGPWEGHFQAFRYESHGDEMRILFPQSGDRETLRVKAAPCNEAKFDYCLDIEGNSRGVKRYYSRKGWDIRELDDVQALASQLAK